MKIHKINVKSVITKSNLPNADYVINPYVGCTHACIYCYAMFMKRFTGHDDSWGSFVDIKVNSPELIPENTTKYKNKNIFISSVTDPYLYIEKKYCITRKLLEKLISLEPNLSIQTKSDLILRDADLLKKFKSCEVGFTITTHDDNLRKEIEPFTSPINRRIQALRLLKKEGLKTYVFIGPILPYLTDWRQIILETKDFTDFYLFESLNVAGMVWEKIKNWLINRHPDLLEKYKNIYFSKNTYWDSVEEEIREFCTKNNINAKIYFHHNAKNNGDIYEQQSFA